MSRRSLLKGALGAATLAAMSGRSSVARAAGRPRRLVLLFTPHGAPAEFFWPTSNGDLSSQAKTVSILAPLQRHSRKMNVLRGVDYVGSDNHGAIRDVFTNKTGSSIDTAIAKKLGVKPLRLGVVPDYAQSFTSDGWLAFDGGIAQPHVPDPARVFDGLVANLPSGGGGAPVPAGPSPAELRKIALGVTRVELEALQRRAGTAARVDKHLAAVSAATVATSAPSAPVVSCTTRPSLPSVDRIRGRNVWAAEAFPDVLAAQIDVAAFALRCGLTRVVSIQCGYANYQVPFSWIGIGDGHHNVSHSSTGSPGRVLHARCQEWFATQWAKLLDQLEAPDPEDPGRTILDNTAVVWTSEIADGQQHDCRGVPTVLFGGGSGALKGGQSVDLGGRSHAALLLTLCKAMGVSGVDVGPGATEAIREVVA